MRTVPRLAKIAVPTPPGSQLPRIGQTKGGRPANQKMKEVSATSTNGGDDPFGEGNLRRTGNVKKKERGKPNVKQESGRNWKKSRDKWLPAPAMSGYPGASGQQMADHSKKRGSIVGRNVKANHHKKWQRALRESFSDRITLRVKGVWGDSPVQNGSATNALPASTGHRGTTPPHPPGGGGGGGWGGAPD